jgi:ankyrin repeat protein
MDNKATEKLFLVANAGYPIDGVRAAMLSGANIDKMNADGNTPLMVATLRDTDGSHTDTIIELLVHGADSNIADATGYTPLHIAVMKKNKDVVKELLKRHAKVNAKSISESTPLSLSKQPQFKNKEIHAALCKASGESGSCTIMGGKRRHNRTNKKTRKVNKKRHTVRRRR